MIYCGYKKDTWDNYVEEQDGNIQVKCYLFYI